MKRNSPPNGGASDRRRRIPVSHPPQTAAAKPEFKSEVRPRQGCTGTAADPDGGDPVPYFA